MVELNQVHGVQCPHLVVKSIKLRYNSRAFKNEQCENQNAHLWKTHGTIKKRKDSNGRKAAKPKAKIMSAITTSNNLPPKSVPIEQM